MNEFNQPRQRLSSNNHGVALSHLCEFQDFLGRSAPIHQIAIMGFDCATCQAASAKNCMARSKARCFRFRVCGNPPGFISSEAALLCASELDQFGRRRREGMSQADSDIRSPRRHLRHILQCLSGRRGFIHNNEKSCVFHSGSLTSSQLNSGLLQHFRWFRLPLVRLGIFFLLLRWSSATQLADFVLLLRQEQGRSALFRRICLHRGWRQTLF